MVIVKASAQALFSAAVATVSRCVENVRRSNLSAQTSETNNIIDKDLISPMDCSNTILALVDRIGQTGSVSAGEG